MWTEALCRYKSRGYVSKRLNIKTQPSPVQTSHPTSSSTTSRSRKFKMVLLVTSDNEQFVVDKEVAERSVLIKNMLEGAFRRRGRARLWSLC